MTPVALAALERVIERVLETKAAGETPVVVFDLDDTLFLTRNRHLRILREFGLAAEARHLRYSIVETAKNAGLIDAARLKELETFWFHRFFKNEYLGEDAPVAGAPAYVRSIVEAGATVVYLTGRDEGMREGTLKALEKAGFPMPDGEQVRLVLKPRFEDKDLEFKKGAFEKIAEIGAVVAGFENEPSYLGVMAARFPRMTAVLLKTQHSGRAPEAPFEMLEAADFTC